MKALKLIFAGLLFVSNAAFSQDITSDMFVTPLNTGTNMTLGMSSPVLDQFIGGQLGAFYDLNNDGIINSDVFTNSSGYEYTECIGLVTIEEGFFGFQLWGDDTVTEEVDGLQIGEWPIFKILTTNNIIVSLDDLISDDFEFSTGSFSETYNCFDYEITGLGYCTNRITVLGNFGCTDSIAVNYDIQAVFDDGSCEYPSVVCEKTL